MDIPIRFKFLDKLKLYQDYLKKDTMLEKTKSEYWLYEKAILYWAYSREHQHIGRPLDADVFCKDIERVTQLPKIAEKISNNPEAIKWVKENVENKPAAIHALANLNTLGFVTKVSKYSGIDEGGDSFKDFPKKVYVNPKGFLLGELLYETFNNPSFFSENFRKYKIAMLTFSFLFIVLLATAVLIFLEKIINLSPVVIYLISRFV